VGRWRERVTQALLEGGIYTLPGGAVVIVMMFTMSLIERYLAASRISLILMPVHAEPAVMYDVARVAFLGKPYGVHL